jgi:hypothetical protein
MPLRLLARAAPFVLGAVATAIWLRRRTPERPALPMRTGPAGPPPRRTGRFDRAPAGRFARSPQRRRVDIVTVVDDLLGAAR